MWFRSIFNAKDKKSGENEPAGATGSHPPDGPRFGGLPDRTLRLLNQLSLNSGPLRLALPSGSRPSPLARTAIEFREHRQYAPGDDFRYVDWKASARQEHIYVKQGEFAESYPGVCAAGLQRFNGVGRAAQISGGPGTGAGTGVPGAGKQRPAGNHAGPGSSGHC